MYINIGLLHARNILLAIEDIFFHALHFFAAIVHNVQKLILTPNNSGIAITTRPYL